MKIGACDLNVLESQSYPENLANIKQLISLGYSVIALNRIVLGSELMIPKKLTSDLKQKSKDSLKSKAHKFLDIIERLKQDVDESKFTEGLVVPNDFKILSRVTLFIENMDQMSIVIRDDIYKNSYGNFDIISISPSDEKILRAIVEGAKIDVDIVYLPLENKLDFKLSHKILKMGIDKNVTFEITYCHAIKSPSLRKYIFYNGKLLTSRTKGGRGVILSSGGESKMDFRSPFDVINFSSLFEYKLPGSNDCVCRNPQQTVAHAFLRKHTFKGAVMIMDKPVDVEMPLVKRFKV